MMLLEVLFYWYSILITATQGGKIYATGEFRDPMGEDEYGDRIETRWVIAGTEGRSSCYVWAKPEEGYRFAGFLNENGDEIPVTDRTEEIRLWTVTESAQEEDGIVSGNDLYPIAPQKFTAVFLPDDPNDVTTMRSAAETAGQDDAMYDLSGRKLATPKGGQIIIRNRKKVMLSR